MAAGRYGRLRRVIEDNKGIVKESIECCVYYMINPRMPESNARSYAHTQKKRRKKERQIKSCTDRYDPHAQSPLL